LIAAFGALIYALFGLRVFMWSAASVIIDAREYTETGSGGVGAVSVGMDAIFLPYALLALASIVASVMLAAWAHGSGTAIKTVHRMHRWAIVLAFLVMLAIPVEFGMRLGPSRLALVLLPLSGVVWGVQFLLTAVLLGAYAARSAAST